MLFYFFVKNNIIGKHENNVLFVWFLANVRLNKAVSSYNKNLFQKTVKSSDTVISATVIEKAYNISIRCLRRRPIGFQRR